LRRKLSILFLYDHNSTHTNTVKEYLESFSYYSAHNIFYAHATGKAKLEHPLGYYDVVMLHYSVRLCWSYFISPCFAKALVKFSGPKILFIQDEYNNSEIARQWIELLGINLVFTCVPKKYIDIIYPKSRFPRIKFVQVLTGYVPLGLEDKKDFKPIKERKIVIGYRGRELPFLYGDLGREKLLIAQKIKDFCSEKSFLCDIEWDSEKRIYGESWYKFIENCKVTLGTESGSNIFDDLGLLEKKIKLELRINPKLSYQEVHKKYLAFHEGQVRMNQISPRIFEAICLKTALVLFEGSYSNVIKPNLHFIPLKKDFSNVEEIFLQMKNQNRLQSMVERTYQDIILSNKYSYGSFVQFVDQEIEELISTNYELKSTSSFLIQSRKYQPLSNEISLNGALALHYFLSEVKYLTDHLIRFLGNLYTLHIRVFKRRYPNLSLLLSKIIKSIPYVKSLARLLILIFVFISLPLFLIVESTMNPENKD